MPIATSDPTMRVTGVNAGRERTITLGGSVETTGIYKVPVGGPRRVTHLGLAGDAVVDQKNHGGPDQAVYVYGGEDYVWWTMELGQPLEPGTFGENLTIAGLASAGFAIGDRLQVGPVILEVTSPRIPCSTLAARMSDRGFVKRFRNAERPGLYCRVIQEGDVQPGDLVLVTPYAGATLTILEMFRSYYDNDPDEATIRRHLAAPISVRARAAQEDRLKKLLARQAQG